MPLVILVKKLNLYIFFQHDSKNLRFNRLYWSQSDLTQEVDLHYESLLIIKINLKIISKTLLQFFIQNYSSINYIIH